MKKIKQAILRTFRGVSQNFSEVFQELVPAGSGQMVIKTSADAADAAAAAAASKKRSKKNSEEGDEEEEDEEEDDAGDGGGGGNVSTFVDRGGGFRNA